MSGIFPVLATPFPSRKFKHTNTVRLLLTSNFFQLAQLSRVVSAGRKGRCVVLLGWGFLGRDFRIRLQIVDNCVPKFLFLAGQWDGLCSLDPAIPRPRNSAVHRPPPTAHRPRFPTPEVGVSSEFRAESQRRKQEPKRQEGVKWRHDLKK